MRDEDKSEKKSEKKAAPASVSGGLADFLSAPKKKRKNHVVLALSESFPGELRSGIRKYLSGFNSALILVEVNSPEELVRQLQRHIHLLVLDDSFAELDQLMKLVKFMKNKKSSDGMPVLFLTREPADLISSYRSILLAHQENDDHLSLKGAKEVEVLAGLKQALETRNRRRSRRFKVGSEISYQILGSDTWLPAQLVDISLHGAAISARSSDAIFQQRSQIRIQIPVSQLLSPDYGEVFRVSCMVRRVSISGGIAGLSFEHVTERQLSLLTDIVTGIAARTSINTEVDNQRV